jgi:AcrR family transcriptional regulator
MTNTKPPRRIRRDADDMRKEALAAARQLILSGTDTALTMRAVADRAGVTYPNLSHHFGSAAGLHAAIAEDLVRELLAGLEAMGEEVQGNEHDYRKIVDRVFEMFEREGLGKVLTWLVSSKEKARLEPVNTLIQNFIKKRAGEQSPGVTERIARDALIVAYAAYAESTVGPLLGDVFGAAPELRRAYFAAALAALRHS